MTRKHEKHAPSPFLPPSFPLQAPTFSTVVSPLFVDSYSAVGTLVGGTMPVSDPDANQQIAYVITAGNTNK